jgi:hypothetical protein
VTIWDAVWVGALLLLGLILLLLVLQSLKLQELWRLALGFQQAVRWAKIWEAENLELRSALRAEKAHIEQLQRKVEILQGVVSVEG